MKVRLTVMTENNQPVEVLGDNPEAKIKEVWNAVLNLMSIYCENGDTAYIENVEIVEVSE